MNKVVLLGHLGRDPEIIYTPGGSLVATFSIATDESFKGRNGEQQQHTEWHRIVAFGKLGETCGEYLTKGKLVYIEGSIRSRQWEDQSGNKHTSYEIIARNMQMFGSRPKVERAASAGSHPAASHAQASEERYDSGPESSSDGEIADDDIPL